MTNHIDLAFKVQCRLCGCETIFDLHQIHAEEPPTCSACGHAFAVGQDLALSLRKQVAEFMKTVPSGTQHP